VDVRITPEPEERDVVLAAVERLLSGDPLPMAYRSGWRSAGIRENVGEADDQAGLPRSNPGATRA
jgi:hypothetical protein